MPDLLLAANKYGGYISVIKLLTFLAFFFLWLPLDTWVQNDAKAVETNDASVRVWSLEPAPQRC